MPWRVASRVGGVGVSHASQVVSASVGTADGAHSDQRSEPLRREASRDRPEQRRAVYCFFRRDDAANADHASEPDRREPSRERPEGGRAVWMCGPISVFTVLSRIRPDSGGLDGLWRLVGRGVRRCHVSREGVFMRRPLESRGLDCCNARGAESDGARVNDVALRAAEITVN